MPVLNTYTAKPVDLPATGGRRAEASDFYAGGLQGQAIQTAASVVLERQESEEARQALVRSSEIRAKYARALDEAALSGGDLEKLKAQMMDELAKVGEGFQTKQGSENLAMYTANSELMYDEQANRIEVQRAAANARLEGHKYLNSSGQIIQSNPAYLGEAERGVEALVSTFKLRPEQKAEIADGLKKDLNMAAAIASARINPEKTKVELEAGRWNLSPEQRNTAIDRATREISMDRANQEYIRAQEERERREANDKATDKYLKAIWNGDRGVRRAIMDDPDLKPTTRQHLIDYMRARAKEAASEERRSNPAVFNALYLRSIAPEGTPGRLYTDEQVFEAVKRGDVNTRDAEFLRNVIARQKDEDGRTFSARLGQQLRAVQSALANDVVLKNTPGVMDGVMNDLIAQAEKKAKQMRKDAEAGKGPGPEAMLDPDAKEYFFKPGLLKATADRVKAQKITEIQQVVPAPKAGDVREFNGVKAKFKGGDPAKETSWEILSSGGPTVSGKIGGQ